MCDSPEERERYDGGGNPTEPPKVLSEADKARLDRIADELQGNWPMLMRLMQLLIVVLPLAVGASILYKIRRKNTPKDPTR